MINKIKSLQKYLQSLIHNNLIWLALIIFALVLPTLIDADLSLRVVLLLSFTALFSRFSPAIIIIYSILYIIYMLVMNHFRLPQEISINVFDYLIIFIITELLTSPVYRIRKKAKQVFEP